MTFPLCNQADLLAVGPMKTRERRHWDGDGYELTEIRNGATQCPICKLWWPNIEQPAEWEEDEDTGRWNATGWWGGVLCEFCGLLQIEQPDGTQECYQL